MLPTFICIMIQEYELYLSFFIFLVSPTGAHFFILCSASAVHVQSVYVGLTQQVHIGRGTT